MPSAKNLELCDGGNLVLQCTSSLHLACFHPASEDNQTQQPIFNTNLESLLN